MEKSAYREETNCERHGRAEPSFTIVPLNILSQTKKQYTLSNEETSIPSIHAGSPKDYTTRNTVSGS